MSASECVLTSEHVLHADTTSDAMSDTTSDTSSAHETKNEKIFDWFQFPISGSRTGLNGLEMWFCFTWA